MKIMAKIKDLLANREKLARYDELTEWKKQFEDNKALIPRNCTKEVGNYIFPILLPSPLPEHIKQIIISALDAEIKKLDEE